MKWRNIFTGLAEDADNYWDQMIQRVRRSFAEEPIYLQPYLGYGTAERFYLRGRVLEGERIRASEDGDSPWENLAATYRRFETDEIANAQVQLWIGERTEIVHTDAEGYFFTEFAPPPTLLTEAANRPLWHEVKLIASTSAHGDRPAIHSEETSTRIMVPPATSNFGVISDLDDTVLQTNATNLLHMARLTLLHNARTRLPFAGVAELYQALHHGPHGDGQNPIFYVSSSPWNLYDLLVEFMAFHGVPHGPIFLRDLGFGREMLQPSGHHSHKLAQVEHILSVYPDLTFILIGDSGQEDPEIYREVVRRFPRRIVAIYIRDVSLERRDREVDALIQEVGKEHVPMLRVADTIAAAEHAAAHNLIEPAALASIQRGKQADKAKR